MTQIKTKLTLAVMLIISTGCSTSYFKNNGNLDKKVSTKTISIISPQTKQYNIGRKSVKDGLFDEDITFNSNDKYILIKNSKWMLPLVLKVMDGDKVIKSFTLKDEKKEIKFLVPTNILKSGMNIKVENSFFKTVLMNSKIK